MIGRRSWRSKVMIAGCSCLLAEGFCVWPASEQEHLGR